MLTAIASRPQLPPPATNTHATPQLAIELFECLAPLHGLSPRHIATVAHAAFGMPRVRALGVWGPASQTPLNFGLDSDDRNEIAICEAAARYACDLVPERTPWDALDAPARLRVVWIAALLRLAESVVLTTRGADCDVHAAWTETDLHLEFDGMDPACDVMRAAHHVAALEMVSGRRVLLTSSVQRRSRYTA